ncbi:hypothetical protein L1987_26837 [Smallanthus sonchifolius]|uniref:Uncharacterized protein n=1 Tax=Smallanthus sonchifolius TaxID=185202 RepID=A0ACB9IBQ0_9ASTR|nr:hypothetical protein L1987_26837 [Smallanthus sonchifolius]
MGNCLKPVMRPGALSYEEAKPLVISTVHDQVVLKGDNCCKTRKKVRLKVQSPNAEDVAAETTMTLPRVKKGVRVKVVLTKSELKQILNRASIYHHTPPPPPPPPPPSSSGQIMVKCRRSRRSSVMCGCSWNPTLHTIPE